MGNNARRKAIVGTVISDKMEKAVTVQWEVRKKHPIYKKFVITHKKCKAADIKNEAKAGDVVKIVSTRPLSKEIRWRVAEILQKAQRGQ